MAGVVKIGVVCRDFGIASVKFEFGSSKLAGPAFTTTYGEELADRCASYIVAGNFATDLGQIVMKNPQLLTSILKFRESSVGIALRKEIFGHLRLSSGNEVASAVNAGLSQSIPTAIMEQSRKSFSTLFIDASKGSYPAVWYDDWELGDKALSLWRIRSAKEFQTICEELQISEYDPCPCGSGERLKFCCKEALSQ